MTGQADTTETNAPEPTEPTTAPQEPAGDVKPTEPAPNPEPAPEPAPQPQGNTVNRYKYERDMAAKDKRIAELEEQNKGFAALQKDLDDFKAQIQAKDTEAALKKAGCHDTVAASARLGEFDGDIDKLKEAAPYLFSSTDGAKSTGGSQKGAPDPSDELDAKLDKAFGLK